MFSWTTAEHFETGKNDDYQLVKSTLLKCVVTFAFPQAKIKRRRKDRKSAPVMHFKAQLSGRCYQVKLVQHHLVCVCLCAQETMITLTSKGSMPPMSDMLPFLVTAPEAKEANCRYCPHLCHPQPRIASIPLSNAHSHTEACSGLPAALTVMVILSPAS